MSPEDVRLLVQALEKRPSQKPSLMPGTVTGVDKLSNVVSVKIDGQDWGDDVDVRPLVADVGFGDRVMVLHDPPHGGYVIGWVARPFSAGETVAYFDATVRQNNVTAATPFTWASGEVVFYGGRRYRIEFGGQAIRRSGNPRAALRAELVTANPSGGTTTTVLQGASVCLPASDYCDNLSKSVLFDPRNLSETLGFEGGNVQGTLRLRALEIRPSGAVDFVASATSPAYLMVTDAGPAPQETESPA